MCLQISISVFMLALTAISYLTLLAVGKWMGCHRGVALATICLTFNITW